MEACIQNRQTIYDHHFIQRNINRLLQKQRKHHVYLFCELCKNGLYGSTNKKVKIDMIKNLEELEYMGIDSGEAQLIFQPEVDKS